MNKSEQRLVVFVKVVSVAAFIASIAVTVASVYVAYHFLAKAW